MRQSKLFSHTLRDAPADEVSVNAKLLTRGAFVDKLMAGSYSFLPLGLRVLNKIAAIIRDEMNKISGQEVLMPALLPKENWEKTGRWADPGREVMFQLTGRGEREYGLGWTHEEIVTPLVKKFVQSHKDLPLAIYQIQTKFRDEPRAKSGLLRGREFGMKDMYSFHADEADLDKYYEEVKQAYLNVFKRLGLDAKVVEASGGSFSKYSHEFQVATPAGEDIVISCESCNFAQNREITNLNAGDACPNCSKKLNAERAIEVGNIFKLKDKYSKSFNFSYNALDGSSPTVLMGCYGIGLGRALGAIVETNHDEAGIVWPASVAPFKFHVVALQDSEKVHKAATDLYNTLQEAGLEVLFDDRAGVSIGEKLMDADIIGLPVRLVVSEKTLAKDGVEFKKRNEKEVELVKIKEVIAKLS